METWQKCLDKNGVHGALLTDLNKALHCLLCDLLIAEQAPNVFNTNHYIEYKFLYPIDNQDLTSIALPVISLTLRLEFIKVKY